jgi:signal transduction histidine kinase
MPDTGPGEVRNAARAFNMMQKRLQNHVRERTQMLAAITHDLQTPITRMRLRLEKIKDPALRERFLNDIAAMQAMVREGLDLARSAESTEAPAALDLDSMLESMVEDAAEAGHPVIFLHGCEHDVIARAQAVRRTLANLIDNALKYGGAAQVSASMVDGRAVVSIRDAGPGIPEDQLEAMFQPFARLDASRSRDTGGVGLGLTIARNLAEREGGALELRNHPHGGIEAVLSYPAVPRPRPAKARAKPRTQAAKPAQASSKSA